MTERQPPSVVCDEEITPFVYDRAKRLDNTLARLTLSEVVFEDHQARGELFALRIQDPDNPDPSSGPTIVLDRQFLKGMNRVAFTLYKDLVDEGEQALATNLLSQDDHRRDRYGVTRWPEDAVSSEIRTSLSSDRNR